MAVRVHKKTCDHCGRSYTVAQLQRQYPGGACSRACLAQLGSTALAKRYRETALERFFARVSPEPTTGCWLWTGTVTTGGYGKFDQRRAHRVSLEIATGKAIPAGLDVCHRCDFPPCVNPDHLFLGTAKDNMQDAARKGRAKKAPQPGMENGRAILTDQLVLELRRLYAAGHSSVELATRFGLGRVAVYRAATGRSWRHLPA